MRTLAGAVMAAATILTAGEVNPKLARLIGPETRIVYGIDFERYRTSMLSRLFPARFEPLSEVIGQMITIAGDQRDGKPPLIVVVGPRPPDLVATPLDGTAAILGDAETSADAVRRWNQDERPGDLAAKIVRLAESFDLWFLMVKPLERIAGLQETPPPKYVQELMELVEEISGGIRLGAFNEVRLEVSMKSAEDATALAALARWLPAFIQMMDPREMAGRVVDALDQYATRAEGRFVSISFILPERRVEEIWKAIQEQRRSETPMDGSSH